MGNTHEIFQDLDRELQEIWDVYDLHPNDVLREEITRAVKEVREKHEKTEVNTNGR